MKSELAEVSFIEDQWGDFGSFLDQHLPSITTESSSIFLPNDTYYKGILFKGNTYLHIYANGNLMSGTLGADSWIQGWQFKNNSNIGFYEDETIRDGTILDTDIFFGGSYVYLKSGKVSFYDNGNIKKGYVRQPFMWENMAQNFRVNVGEIHFHSNLAWLFQAEVIDPIEVTYKGQIMRTKPNTMVQWFRKSAEGFPPSIRSCAFEAGTKIDDFTISDFGYAHFFLAFDSFQLGAVNLIMNAGDILLNGVIANRKYWIALFESGKIRSLVTTRRELIGIASIPEVSTVKFHENGHLAFFGMSKDKYALIDGQRHEKAGGYLFDELGNFIQYCRSCH